VLVRLALVDRHLAEIERADPAGGDVPGQGRAEAGAVEHLERDRDLVVAEQPDRTGDLLDAAAVSRAIEASDLGLAGLSKDMKVNSLTPEQLVKFRDATMPAVKKIIVEKHGAEGEAMMKAFLEAIEVASK